MLKPLIVRRRLHGRFVIVVGLLLFHRLQEFIDAIEALPESDSPSYFGLPENIDRSLQRMDSSAVITKLKILKRADTRAAKFDREVWANELNPILALWKKLNTVSRQ